jgi:hypothetical protein
MKGNEGFTKVKPKYNIILCVFKKWKRWASEGFLYENCVLVKVFEKK